MPSVFEKGIWYRPTESDTISTDTTIADDRMTNKG